MAIPESCRLSREETAKERSAPSRRSSPIRALRRSRSGGGRHRSVHVAPGRRRLFIIASRHGRFPRDEWRMQRERRRDSEHPQHRGHVDKAKACGGLPRHQPPAAYDLSKDQQSRNAGHRERRLSRPRRQQSEKGQTRNGFQRPAPPRSPSRPASGRHTTPLHSAGRIAKRSTVA